MSSLSQRLLIASITALVVALGVYAVPAQAVDAIPTTAQVTVSGGDQMGETVYITAYVFASGQVPTGSVVFTGVGDGTPKPLQGTGFASVSHVLTSNDPFPVSIAFTGTNGFADATASTVVRPLQKAYLHAEPTVLKLSGPRLTLTMAAYVRDALGGPLAGRKITFTLLAPPPVFLEKNNSLPVCTAVSNANGLATCGGSGLIGSIVSILVGGAYATYVPAAIVPAYDYVKLPVVMQ